MSKLKTHMRTLGHQLNDLHLHGGGSQRIIMDVQSGRAYAQLAFGRLQAARDALRVGDEAGAMALLLDAQAAYIIALRKRIDDHGKLMRRPALGRPSSEWLAMRLRDAVDAGPPEGTLIARIRAAIAADDALRAGYGDKSDNAVRRAYREKKRA